MESADKKIYAEVGKKNGTKACYRQIDTGEVVTKTLEGDGVLYTHTLIVSLPY